ncbi:MAG: septum formation family protein [Acidimicrobiales bacterium]
MLLGMSLLASACSDDEASRGDDGAITEAGDVDAFDARVGDCLRVDEDNLTQEFEQLPAVPCAEEHSHEIYAVVDMAEQDEGERFTRGAAYPGESVLMEDAQSVCAAEFEPYVGTDYVNSGLFFTYLVPSVQSWQEEDERDRTIVCLVSGTGEPETGSVKGSQR